jgi:uncharacterized protein
MPRRLLIQFLAFTLVIIVCAFAIGALVTGPAPSAVGTLSTDFPVEAVQIPVANGSDVHGWLAYGERDGGVVLLAHSMRSNRLEMLSRARFLNNQGYSVLLIDLYAHGETAGKRITFGLRESESIEAAVAFLRTTFPNQPIGAIGVSLGAAAIVLANQRLNLDAIILESLHPTIEEAVENRLKLHFGKHGTVLLPLLLSQLSFYLDTPVDELSPINRINDINSPLLLISGTSDAHTTLPETERLFAAAREPKDLWIISGAGHFNMHTYAGREYEQRIADFLSQYVRKERF